MMDTDILFRDSRRFGSDYNNIPLMTSDSADSTSSDGAEADADTFNTKLCTWNYDSGLDNDFELMLERFNFDPISGDDFQTIVGGWEHNVKEEVEITIDKKPLLSDLELFKQDVEITVDQKPLLSDLEKFKQDVEITIDQKPLLSDLEKFKQDAGLTIDQKPLLSDLEKFKQDHKEIKYINKEIITSSINTGFDVSKVKKEIPQLDEITSVPFFEYSDFTTPNFSINYAANDLPANLDLCSFINEDETPLPVEEQAPQIVKTSKPKFKAGRKKIDHEARRYIVENEKDEEQQEEEEHVDVETISENGNNPVLEAGDLNSLLEQFEATEVEVNDTTVNNVIQIKEQTEQVPLNVTNSTCNTKIPVTNDKKDNEQNKKQIKGALLDASIQPATAANKESGKSQVVPKAAANVSSNNKQIIEALPQELIDRIKESGKRKRIEIIDPVPNNTKKRKVQDGSVNSQTTATSTSTSNNELIPNLQFIELDHSYCSIPTPHKKHPKKDSGYISAAEEEDKFLQNQPIVKNADGKLMISLLKVNTIKPIIAQDINKKKKLNIEEYKMRRLGILNTPTSSVSNSPISSNCSSPLPEDENTKRLKHEEKLRRMALELLSTPPKSSCSGILSKPVASSTTVEVPPTIKDSKPVASSTTAEVPPTVKDVVTPSPADMDVITIVSIGVNTDISGRNPLTPAEKLAEIKPLLENASVRISSNSLINSLIENIPKVIKAETSVETPKVKEVHGEDKTIIYLPKNRKPPSSSSVGVQTSITLLGENKRRYRRRKDSSSSSESTDSGEIKSSNRSNDSRYSKSSGSSRSTSISSSSSRSSVRTRSRSSSRSPSPQRRNRKRRGYDKEYIQEVEERRVVYVGKIKPKTTKKDLYRRFSRFGSIKTISLHFRDHGDNYGFVTFTNKLDAYAAIEHGNDDPYETQYDLSFGGRRLFCKTSYSDLDNVRDDYGYPTLPPPKPSSGESFDRLLQEMQEKLKRRKL